MISTGDLLYYHKIGNDEAQGRPKKNFHKKNTGHITKKEAEKGLGSIFLEKN